MVEPGSRVTYNRGTGTTTVTTPSGRTYVGGQDTRGGGSGPTPKLDSTKPPEQEVIIKQPTQGLKVE